MSAAKKCEALAESYRELATLFDRAAEIYDEIEALFAEDDTPQDAATLQVQRLIDAGVLPARVVADEMAPPVVECPVCGMAVQLSREHLHEVTDSLAKPPHRIIKYVL